jgi:superfamily II DNA helicase RecQ
MARLNRQKEKIMPGALLSDRTAAAIAEKLPGSIKALGATKGVGPRKAQNYGTGLIPLFRAFQTPEKEQGGLF